MHRVSRATVGTLLFGAVLLPVASAHAETLPQSAAGTSSLTQVVTDGGSGSSAQ
ncbi:hypothetical protein ACIRRA_08435 [Nocardia sp. NPDC101769]|uniref:hypothetical protein n=1 Tax=Nocardia sp. NPDC101769 TaxID=3364333 RepID=UPI00382038EA